MSLTVTCPDCDKSLKVKEEAAGKKIRCPGCSTVFPIPAKSIEADDDFLSGLDEAVSIKQKPVDDDDEFDDGDLPPAKPRSGKPTKKKSVKKKSSASKSIMGRIWGGIVTAVIVLVTLGGLAGRINQLVANRPVTWATFRHPSGFAQIDMPGTPTLNAQQSINGSQTYSLTRFEYNMSLSTAPMIGPGQNLVAPNPAAADLMLNQMQAMVPQQMKGSRLIASRRMMAGAIHGLEMKVDAGGNINLMRFFLFPEAVIGAEYITRNETKYGADRDRFFNSMRGPDGNLINSVTATPGATQPGPSSGVPENISVPNTAAPERPTRSLAEVRRALKTKLIRQERANRPVPDPPAAMARTVTYDAPSGKLKAYLTTVPQDGKKRPAIVWITGGDCNSIDDGFFKESPPNNDQTADAFRKAGIITLYPSLRGGNDNPGLKECFLGEVDDVIAAADFLSKQDGVDPNLIYLGGHSTGGTLALLVAESTDRFRAVFSFGPVDDIRGYGDEFVVFDSKNVLELNARTPAHWLKSIQCRTFVIEGSLQPGNAMSLKVLSVMCRNPKATFLPVTGANHFSVLAPVTKLIAEKILKDEGPITNINLAAGDLNLKFAP